MLGRAIVGLGRVGFNAGAWGVAAGAGLAVGGALGLANMALGAGYVASKLGSGYNRATAAMAGEPADLFQEVGGREGQLRWGMQKTMMKGLPIAGALYGGYTAANAYREKNTRVEYVNGNLEPTSDQHMGATGSLGLAMYSNRKR